MGLMQWFSRGQRAMYQAKSLKNTDPNTTARQAKQSFLTRLMARLGR